MTNHTGVLKEVMGGFWSDISKISIGKGKDAKRERLDQARMKLVQQYLAAVLDVQAFGADDAKTAYEAGDRGAIIDAAATLTAFNEGGDEEPLPAGFDEGTADLDIWDVLP